MAKSVARISETQRLEKEASENSHHLVLLLHGINTRGLWMDEVLPALEKAGFSVAALSYGEFSVPRFLGLPFLRKKAIERVWGSIETAHRVYRDANGSYPQHTSIISHSFGTWLILRILSQKPNFKLFRIVVCGSVNREDYDLAPILHQFSAPLLNEIGTRDYWPAIAESAGWGYGSIGSTGMHHAAVRNRWHQGFRHSDFLTADFCTKFWVPFLDDGTLVAGDKAQGLPRWIRLLAWIPLNWILLLIIISAVALVSNAAIHHVGGIDLGKEGRCFFASKYSLYYWLAWGC